jgi:2-methylisocitrate lyase-like PEP mutase family enzyme
MAQVIERGRAYAATGIDALMVLDLGPDRLPEVAAALPGLPQVWIGGVVPPVPNFRELAGFAIALYPFNTIAAVALAVSSLWQSVRETGDVPQDATTLTRMRRELSLIAGMQTYWDIEDDLAGRPRGTH